MKPLVSAVRVGKSFGSVKALEDVTLDVMPTEVVCVIGPSGSGKTTFLRCINQLERIDAGAIWLDGELTGYRIVGDALHPLSEAEIARQRRITGMVFQRFNLFPHMTALQNVTEGPIQVLKKPPQEARASAMALLERVGLSHKANVYPAELSGGQQQRVAIARSLAMQPKLMLFDEPTSALDAELVGEVLGVMRDLAQTGMTMIVVTHEMGFARSAARRVVFMDEGRIVEVATPDTFFSNPESERARDFLSKVLAH